MMCCMIAACTFCGYSLASAAMARFRFLRELVAAMKKLRINIVELLLSVDLSLKQTNFLLFKKISDNLSQKRDLSEAWEAVASSESILKSLSDAERTVLDDFFRQLGGSGRVAQEETILSCVHFFETSSEEAKARAVRVGRLYTSMGFLIGLSISILMI